MLDATIEKGVLMSTGLARKQRRNNEATGKPTVIAPPHRRTRMIASGQSLPSRDASERLGGTPADRRLGARMARIFVAFGLAYAVVVVAGFVSLGNLSKPLPDPYFGIAEGLIFAMAPVMVTLMLAVYACAPSSAKTRALAALGWMLAGAAITMTVHFVLLTVGRRVDASTMPGYTHLLSFTWPSVIYGVDIVAWDAFIGLSLLFAATAFTDKRDALARKGLLIAGALCLVGLIGPAVDNLAWRGLGIFGYAVVLPLTCIPISHAFSRSEGVTAQESTGSAAPRAAFNSGP